MLKTIFNFKHNLTDAEKIEYRAIIDLFIKIGK